MNLQFYVEKLRHSPKFKDFMKNNPKAYFCSGFFTIDVSERRDNQRHIDFYEPKTGKMFSFKMDSPEKEIELVPTEMNVPKIPEEMSFDIDFNFESVESLVSKEIEKNKIKSNVQKILASLQKLKGKNILVCTVFVTGFGLLKVIIDLKSGKVTEFEKKSFFDIIKRVK